MQLTRASLRRETFLWTLESSILVIVSYQRPLLHDYVESHCFATSLNERINKRTFDAQSQTIALAMSHGYYPRIYLNIEVWNGNRDLPRLHQLYAPVCLYLRK